MPTAPETPSPKFGQAVWRRFAIIVLAVFFGGLGVIYVALIVIDPYDTGRFPTFMKPGVVDIGQRTADASRARNPRFNAAVFGNSRGQLLDPTKLSDATGLDFVQLTTPGSGPRELFTLTRYYMAHHARIDAVVLSVDERWCSHDPAIPVTFPFPFWLYRGNLEYLANLLSSRSISFARERIKLALGRATASDPRGYWDYETGRTWNFHPLDQPPTPRKGAAAVPIPTDFPAMALLDQIITALPGETRLVIIAPPVYWTTLAPPGSQVAADLPFCKAEFARRAASRPRSVFLDYLVDSPLSHDPRNFMDPVHYRMNIARLLEARIANVLNAAVPSPASKE